MKTKFNEDKRSRERYVEFNPSALRHVAAKATGRDYCENSRIYKVAEGGFNKVFLLETDDGREVVARIPTPISGPPHYSTASEVATINFLRNVLQIPVPRILDYSPSLMNNPVGAEYIIMERVQGESLASRWLTLSTDEVKHIMTQIAEIEQKMFDYKFPGYGCLYHKHDIEDEENHLSLQVEDFCIGPVATRQFWHDERGMMEVDRGPWTSAEDAMTAAARRELSHLRHHAKPKPRQTFLLPTDYDIDPREHASLLSKFLQLAPFLVPAAEKTYLQQQHNHSTLRHPDLSLANILLVPGSTQIASIIDWQDATILPLFIQSGYPDFCEHDTSRPQSLKIPTLPEEYYRMSEQEQIKTMVNFRLEEANLYYTAATGIHNKKHLNALRTIPHLGMRQYLIQQTAYPWDADVINLRAALVGITDPDIWSTGISSLPCPVSFSKEERKAAMDESSEWNESEALLSRVRSELGIDLEGGTEPENFEWAAQKNAELRLEMLRQCDVHEREICWRNWPYKDDEDVSSPPHLD
ncbi:phosphotransferase enzyme family protein [Xylona heveae TC161]|uniref:Phosphotransferase enzyme family protein n=1 Tax=Xylona heveae (strain CBS 132557 / TC161) TaxID=1328760 RepID=A0A164ZXM4_XYLHT|nr:phosphotransferase enzyme family protein [Xylona heveae TC161]KZF19666.1 phosphotransferase enzyme family protein [Xylona heveae TC161]